MARGVRAPDKGALEPSLIIKTILAATILALGVASAMPAYASEEYFYGPSRPIHSLVVARDVGSVGYPYFDGVSGSTTPRSQILIGNASSAGVESLNSAPVGALIGTTESNFPGAIRSTR